MPGGGVGYRTLRRRAVPVRGARWVGRVGLAAALVLTSIIAGTVASGLIDRTTASSSLHLPGLWSSNGIRPTTDLGVQFRNHSAVLLDRRLLGDRWCNEHPSNCGKVLVAGGATDPAGKAVAVTALFNPENGTWERAGDLPSPRESADMVLLPTLGKVFITGGLAACQAEYPLVEHSPNGCPSSESERPSAPTAPALYDISAHGWTPAAPTLEAHYATRAVALNGERVLIVGGSAPPKGTDDAGNAVGLDPSPTSEIYDAGSNHWHRVAGCVDATGGHNHDREHMSCVDHDAGSTFALLPNGNVLVTGGHHDSTTATCPWRFSPSACVNSSDEIFDAASETFRVLSNQSIGEHWEGAAVYIPPVLGNTGLAYGKVLVLGGYFGSVLHAIPDELFDPVTETWTSIGRELSQRHSGWFRSFASDRLPAVVLPDSRVLVAGDGDGGTTIFVQSNDPAEIFDPVSGTWNPTGPMTQPRSGHTLTWLGDGDGRAVAVGGDNGSIVSSSYSDPPEAWSEQELQVGSSPSPTPSPGSDSGSPPPNSGNPPATDFSPADSGATGSGSRPGNEPDVPRAGAGSTTPAVGRMGSPSRGWAPGALLPRSTVDSHGWSSSSLVPPSTLGTSQGGNGSSPTASAGAADAGPAVRPIQNLAEADTVGPPGGAAGAGAILVMLIGAGLVGRRLKWL